MNTLGLTLRTLLLMQRQRLWEPVLVWLCIMMAIAGLSAVRIINAQASASLQASDAFLSTSRVTAKTHSGIDKATYVSLRRQGFRELVAITEVTLPEQPSSLYPTTLIGVDLANLPAPVLKPEADLHQANAWVNTLPDDVPANATITMPDGSERHVVIGVSDVIPADVMVVGMATLYQHTSTPESLPITALLWQGALSAARKQALMAALPPDLTLQEQSENADNAMAGSFQLNLWAMGMLMAVVCLFIVVNALHLMYRARQANLIRLRQLGIARVTLMLASIVEMLLLTTLACGPGVALGFAAVNAIQGNLSLTFTQLFNVQLGVIPLTFAQLFIQAWLLSAVSVVMIAAMPLQQLLGRLSLRTAEKKQRNFAPDFTHSFTLVLIVATAISAGFVSSAITALITITLVLLSSCLLITSLSPVVMRFAAKRLPARWPVVHWSAHSAVALSKRTKLALCAFFIALSANIGMNVMVDSFRQATQHWLEQRLFAPVYAATDADLSSQLDALPFTVLPRYGAMASSADLPVEVRSFPNDPVFQSHLLFDATTTDAWQAFYAGRGIFISQQLSFRTGLQLRDPFPLTGVPGLDGSYQVVGVYPDYGNMRAQVLLPADRMQAFSQPGRAYAIFAEGWDIDAIRTALLSFAPDIEVMTREHLETLSMQTFERTFVVTDGLNVITLAVAMLAFVLSISLLAMDIQPQLSLLRSMGVSAWQLRLGLINQYLGLAFFTASAAIPMGIGLGWMLIHLLNRHAFFWTYAMQITPLNLLGAVGFSMLSVLIFISLPIGRLTARLNTREHFAHD